MGGNWNWYQVLGNGLKTLQVTNVIKTRDFKPNGIKPSDHLTMNLHLSVIGCCS